MYRCEICQRIVPPRTPATRVVLQTRLVQYPARHNANRLPSRKLSAARARSIPRASHHDPRDDPGGHGYEIVKEARACPDCAASFHNGRKPSTRMPQRE